MKTAPQHKINSKQDAVSTLQLAVDRKLGAALDDPDKINSQTVADIKRCPELVYELQATLPKEEAIELSTS